MQNKKPVRRMLMRRLAGQNHEIINYGIGNNKATKNCGEEDKNEVIKVEPFN